jgi:hypothetical protein
LYMSQEQTKALGGNNSQGPIYKTYGGLGSQYESKYQSLPSPGFGSAPRLPKEKSSSSQAPGPGAYPSAAGLGSQKESRRLTVPRAVFGVATRDGESKVWLDDEMMKQYHGKDTPGPNSYAAFQGIGKQVDSKYESLPSWKQGTANRFKNKVSAHDETPGAGHYPTYESLGKQTLSQKQTLPATTIGNGTREIITSKVFLSKEHEKAQFGQFTPGPATANRVDAIGPQTLSVKASAPRWGFGSGKRDPNPTNDTPGPGAYFA